ncbi:hypothetical protein HCN44_010743 [Aphidius gifuensis]|uniref:Uncharacterized protein n=1 Tax=Aphidius gifuensis TaxID=684658 RepID=A0A834XUN0_APHGI|nr:protein UXT homolog [Aphidius gifuensis]KAF7991942.1 hypothetical protein HCN44_010743 [Aphidius gifuensis]
MDPTIAKKVLQFETFINDRLKSDLAELEKKLNEKNSEIAEFLQLKSVILTMKNNETIENGFKTKIDIGNNFFVQANVENSSTILIDIGLGYFVELNFDEALSLINVRVKLLELQIKNLRYEIATTNAHIKVLIIGISDLQGLKQS